MMCNHHRAGRLLAWPLITALALGPGLVSARGPWGGSHNPPPADRGPDRTDRYTAGHDSDWAVREAQRRSGGRVLSVQPGDGGYRVKVLRSDGRVEILRLDD